MNRPEIEATIEWLRMKDYSHVHPRGLFGEGLMSDWLHPCGTIGCLAGEYCLMKDENPLDMVEFTLKSWDLPHTAGDFIFYISDWPPHLYAEVMDARKLEPISARLSAERDVMIKRLEYLLEKGE